MHPVRKQRLLMVIFIVLFSSLAVGLVVYALSQNMNMFFSPKEIQNNVAPIAKTIRAGGCVVPGSVKRASDSLEVQFVIADRVARITVSYEGLLPDLFAEGEAVVVKGQLDEQKLFSAVQVLAKHDENYTPPEVAEAMQEEGGEMANFNEACKDLNYDT